MQRTACASPASAAAACFPPRDPDGRAAAIDDNRRAVDEAAALGADCLVLVVGGLPKGSNDIAAAREMVADGIAALLPHARAAKMPLAIEPLHPMYAADRACVNTLEQALDICDLLGEGIGVAIDVYHVWWDPKLAAQIARAGAGGRILAHHICDWLVPTRDLLLDRGMMGDGVIDLRASAPWWRPPATSARRRSRSSRRTTGGSAPATRCCRLASIAIARFAERRDRRYPPREPNARSGP